MDENWYISSMMINKIIPSVDEDYCLKVNLLIVWN